VTLVIKASEIDIKIIEIIIICINIMIVVGWHLYEGDAE